MERRLSVRIAVHEDHFDKLNEMLNNVDRITMDGLRENYGKLKWTIGQSLVKDKWIEIFISKEAFFHMRRYGTQFDKVWDNFNETMVG